MYRRERKFTMLHWNCRTAVLFLAEQRQPLQYVANTKWHIINEWGDNKVPYSTRHMKSKCHTKYTVVLAPVFS